MNEETERLLDAVATYWHRLTTYPLSKQGIDCLRRFRVLGLSENDLCAAMEKGLEQEPNNPLLAFESFCQYCLKDVAGLITLNPIGYCLSKKQGEDNYAEE